jgi:hypothetical protein
MNPVKVIAEWLASVKKIRPELDGKSICPFARMPGIVVVDKLSIEKVEPLGSQLTMYVEDTINSTFEEIDKICRELNNKYRQFIFLPDHPDKKNYINGVETGNGHLPVIIVQTKKELLSARAVLEKTDYYDKWNKEYLEEIKSYGN